MPGTPKLGQGARFGLAEQGEIKEFLLGTNKNMNRALIVRSTKKRKIQPESESEERGLREESKFLIAQCTEKVGKYISVIGLGIYLRIPRIPNEKRVLDVAAHG